MFSRVASRLLVASMAILGAAVPGMAQSAYQVLHEFSGYTSTSRPAAVPLTEAADGTLYGTLARWDGGGPFKHGAIFKLSKAGAFQILHEFNGLDGTNPSGPLLLASDGNLYGTASSGGNGFGTIFRLGTSGLTVVHAFNSVDGASPRWLIQAPDGVLYGTTSSGGVFNRGTVFKTTMDGALTTLHHFAGKPADGAEPSVILQAPDGAFYGITSSGGSALCGYGPDICGYGVAYRMTVDGTLTVLHQFAAGAEGRLPTTLFLASDGNFVGVTADGGPGGSGTVFRMGFDGSVGVLWDARDGSGTRTLVEGRDGMFYGTTANSPCCAENGRGIAFRLSPGGDYSRLHTFTGGADGSSPVAALIQGRDGYFYGTTPFGGYANFGTVYRMDAGGTVTGVHMFLGSAEGAHPTDPLIEATDGSFYGTTVDGGAFNRGTIFRVTRGGEFQTLYTFAGGFDGGQPTGTLLQASDGHLYGTTAVNGAYNQGTLYRITLDGTFRALHAFNRAVDGRQPSGGVVQGSDGLLYGTTRYGGGADRGAVFRSTLDGDVTVLHSFGGGSQGAYPGPLLRTLDGTFYGKTGQCCYQPSIVFRMTAGVVTIVHRFDEYTPYGDPSDVLVQGADGNVYGNFGCNGGIFRIGPSGFSVLTLLGGSCGYDIGPPVVNLAAGADGLLYTAIGNSIYAVNPGGFASLISRAPFYRARVIQASTGDLYGTSECGLLTCNAGLVFRLTPKPAAPTPVVIAPAAGATVQLTWTAMANAASYTIRRRTASGGVVALASGFKGLRFDDTSVIKGQRYYYTITAVNQFGESVASYEVSMTPGRAVASDFDGDGVSDPTVFRPSTGEWYAFPTVSGIPWGGGGDLPVAADYSGDGIADVAVYRPSTGVWHVRGLSAVPFGMSGDIPVPGYYRGGEVADIAVFRPSTGTWHIRGIGAVSWGGAGDVPVPGDYDGDGVTDVAVFRPSNFTWYIRYAAGGSASFVWGSPTDIPVPGDYDGDGRTDVAVYRPARLSGPCCIESGSWYVLPSGNVRTTSFTWGDIGDKPVPGDYDGDGQTDVAVFRPSTGEWYILRAGSRTGIRYVWGGSGDVPISEQR